MKRNKYLINPYKICLVEDDLTFATLFKKKFEKELGISVQHFFSGTDFLAQLDYKPDVVFIDHDLGHEKGLSTVKALTKIVPQTALVYITGNQSSKVAIKSFKRGVSDYILKDENALRNAISYFNKFLKQKKEKQVINIKSFLKLGFFWFASLFTLALLVFTFIQIIKIG